MKTEYLTFCSKSKGKGHIVMDFDVIFKQFNNNSSISNMKYRSLTVKKL